MNYKHLFLFVFTILLTLPSFAQVIGSRENNSPSPRTVEAADITSSNFSGDVNVFNGTYASSYTLGTVSTLSGLSFTLSLDYASTVMGGTTVPVTAGIPYGEGWSLNIPTIYVSYEEYLSYTVLEGCNYINGRALIEENYDDTLPFHPFNESTLHWFAPTVSIPGVASGRLVFKYLDNGNNRAVFVLNAFDGSYIEAYFTGGSWSVQLPDGTIYEFSMKQMAYRNASNRRVFKYENDSPLSADQDTLDSGGRTRLLGAIMPKAEVVKWYCTTITHKNMPSSANNILFDYDSFGKFNFFKEFSEDYQYLVSRQIKVDLEDYTVSMPNLDAYQDVVLKSVSGFTEKLVLNYKTDDASGSKYMLLLSDPEVQRLDSMYNYKSVYYQGKYAPNNAYYSPDATAQNDFTDWKRFLHGYHDDVTQCKFPGEIAVQTLNPYDIIDPAIVGNRKISYQDIPQSDEITFNHGYLESQRLDRIEQTIPGDFYEIRTVVKYDRSASPEGNQHGFLNIDINLATGSQQYALLSNSDGCGTGVESYQTNFGGTPTQYQRRIDATSESVFTTFNQAVKWNTRGNLQYGSSWDNFGIVTSNVFSMPQLPKSYKGFHIQVGPANSDNLNGMDVGTHLDEGAIGCGDGIPSSFYSYPEPYNEDGGITGAAKYAIRAFDPIPNNFGLGLPWYQMRYPYENLLQYYDHSPCGPLYSFGANDNNNNGYIYSPSGPSWVNQPTLADDKFSVAAVELIRYSKNPYMLASVDHIKINGAWTGKGSPGEVLVGRVEMDYKVTVTTIFDNNRVVVGAVATGTTDYSSYKKNSFLLTSIKTIPTDPSKNNPPVYTAGQKADFPTVYFEYDTLIGASLFTEVLRTNVTPIVLSKITNHLGGETLLDYYNINSGTTTIINRYQGIVANPCSGGSAGSSKAPTVAVQINAAVKEVTVKGATASEDQTRTYVYETRITRPKTPYIDPDHYRLKLAMYDVGFTTTTVTEPLLYGVYQPYTIFTHYGKEDGHYLLFGKMKRVNKFNEQGEILSRDETFYEVSKAFENGINRPGFRTHGWDGDYHDYFFGINDDTYTFQFDMHVSSRLGNPTFVEDDGLVVGPAPNYNWLSDLIEEETDSIVDLSMLSYLKMDEKYLDSYFVKKTQDVHTEFEHNSCIMGTESTEGNGNGVGIGPIKGTPIRIIKDHDTGTNPYVNLTVDPNKNEIIAIIEGGDTGGGGNGQGNAIEATSVKNELIDRSPLSDDVLVAAIERVPAMQKDNLAEVLATQPGISDRVWQALFSRSQSLDDKDIVDLMLQQKQFPVCDHILLQALQEDLVSQPIEVKRLLTNLDRIYAEEIIYHLKLESNLPRNVVNSIESEYYQYKVDKMYEWKNPKQESYTNNANLNTQLENDLIQQINQSVFQNPTKDALLGASPLSDAVLLAMINRVPKLKNEMVYQVLNSQPDLSDNIYRDLLDNVEEKNAALVSEILIRSRHKLSDEIVRKFIDKQKFFKQQEIEQLLLSGKQLEKQTQLKLVEQANGISNLVIETVLLNQEYTSKEVMLAIANTAKEIRTKTIAELIKKNPENPSAEIVIKALERLPEMNKKDVYGLIASLPLYELDELDEAEGFCDSIIALGYIPKWIRDIFIAECVNKDTSLSTSCDNPVTTGLLRIETITDYEYYEANPDGKTRGEAYRNLLGVYDTTVSFTLDYVWEEHPYLELKYEPSWQLYKTTTYSPQYPDAFNENKYYYYYDLRNKHIRHEFEYNYPQFAFDVVQDINNDSTYFLNPNTGEFFLSADPLANSYYREVIYDSKGEIYDPSKMPALDFPQKYKMRNLVMQQTFVSKNAEDEFAVEKSDYYVYDNYWNNIPELDREVVLIAPDSCPTIYVEDEELLPGCISIKYIYDGYIENVPYDYGVYIYTNDTSTLGPLIPNYFEYFYVCPYATTQESDTFKLLYTNPPNLIFDDPNDYGLTINRAPPRGDLKTKFMLRSVFSQVDVIYDDNHKSPFRKGTLSTMDFYESDSTILLNKIWLPDFNVYTLETYHVLERNKWGQVQLERDEKGLKTKYNYNNDKIITYKDTACPANNYSVSVYDDIGVPTRVTVGYGTPTPLITEYRYNADYSIDSIIDPNDMVLNYTYDELGRLHQSYRNGIHISKNEYQTWNNDETMSFTERAATNFVKTTLYNNDSDGEAEISVAFIDPLGRSYNIASAVTDPNGITEMVHSGEVKYDIWNRETKVYKPHIRTDAAGLVFEPVLRTTDATNYPDVFSESRYENDSRSRMLKAAKPGLDLANNDPHVKYNYSFVNSICMLCELGLSEDEIADIMPK